MSPSPLAKKLQIKPGYRILLVNAPEGYLAQPGELPDGAQVVEQAAGPVDFVQVFLHDRDELSQLARPAVDQLKPGGLLWLCYPKGSSKVKTDLNRDVLWRAVADTLGLEGVSLVSVDEVWSAMRFRPPR